jgi:hypothetical protein
VQVDIGGTLVPIPAIHGQVEYDHITREHRVVPKLVFVRVGQSLNTAEEGGKKMDDERV